MSDIGWQMVSPSHSVRTAIVYVHGWIEDHLQWKEIYSQLAETDVNQYAVELPGHGDNTTRFTEDAIQASALALAKAVNESPEREWIFVTYSLGGVVGTTALAYVTKKIRHNLVVCSPNYNLMGTGMIRDRMVRLIEQVQAKSNDPKWIENVRSLGQKTLRLRLPKSNSEYRSHLENLRRNLERIVEQNRPERLYMYLQFAKEVLFHNVTPLLQAPNYTIPTTNIVLKGDVYNKMDNAYKTSALKPSVNLKVLTSGYHHIIPQQYHQLLAEYITYLIDRE